MLEQVARYGGFDLKFKGAGDVQVDPHHLMEDAGIVIGQALSKALDDRIGIRRFAPAYAPLDEALARVVIDLGKRPFPSYNLPLPAAIAPLDPQPPAEAGRASPVH